MSQQIGRNDPCLCGSGRKYKHCCLRAVDAMETQWRQLRAAEGRVIPELWTTALTEWGADGFHEAQRRFYDGFEVPVEFEADREYEGLFLTWFALRFAPHRWRGAAPPTAALLYLERARDLSDLERRFLAAVAVRPVSFHHIVGVDPGRSIDLEDLLTGEQCRVVERSASQVARPGGVLFARTLTLDGVSILVGCGSTLIPPTYRLDLHDVRDRLTRGADQLTTEQALALDDVLRRYYLGVADQIHHPPAPKMQNTDGDPLAPTTLHFELQCTPDDAFEALRTLSAVESDPAVLLEGAERDANGRMQAFRVDWTKPGNRLHRSWDNTILGHLEVDGRSLTASVNSRRRAQRLRREIEKRLKGRVMFLRTVEESIDAMMAQARAQPQPEPPPEAPEYAEQLAAINERHWADWLDMNVPALGNQTPREAARTDDGRRRLAALLDEFEWRAQEGDPIQVERLRSILGL